MKKSWRILGVTVVTVLALLALFVALLLRRNAVNVMHPALDKLSSVSFADRWSHPEMLRIRQLGPAAVPPLRRVLREKDYVTTRCLLWVKKKWPGVTRYYSHFPDLQKMTERRHTACQVFQTLGPAGRSAAPELVHILETSDVGDSNSATMALWAIGIDAELCDQLDAALERGATQSGKIQMLNALSNIRPPSARTLQVITAALRDSSPYVQDQAARSLGALGVPTPAALAALRTLQTNSSDDLVVVDASAALWNLDKKSDSVLTPIWRVLESLLERPISRTPGGGSGGQGISAGDQAFMIASELFRKMDLAEAERARALNLVVRWCEKTDRIFIWMVLLPAMIDLGFPQQKCLEVCKNGLAQEEVYYRIHAARLLKAVAAKYSVDNVNLDALLHDREVGVRVYAAAIHWQKQRQAQEVVPVLLEALDRNMHQSYYYDIEILAAALRALGEIGPEAKEALQPLNTLARDPNPAVAKLATDALARIGKQK